MSTFFSICIAALFSWWVWSLKQELSSVHDPGASAAEDGEEGTHTVAGALSHVMHPVPQPVAPPVARVSPREHPSPVKQRRSDGVPVWTIG